MATTKIVQTYDYSQFARSGDNRPLNIKKHRRLHDSMRRYGFIKSFPIIVKSAEKAAGKKLTVKDGQHRLAIAAELGLPVYYVEDDTDFDIAEINTTSSKWGPRDFAEKHAANGLEPYKEALKFADKYKLPVAQAFALLAGTTTFTNCQDVFQDGTYEIKDRAWAEAVAEVYAQITAMARHIRGTRFLQACMAVCRVERLDVVRLLNGAARRRDALVSYSTRDAYLEMLQEVYNYGRQQLVPLKMDAITAMRDRNAFAAAAKAAKAE